MKVFRILVVLVTAAVALNVPVKADDSLTQATLLFSNQKIDAPQAVQTDLNRFRISLRAAKMLLADTKRFFRNQPFYVDLALQEEAKREALRPLFEQAVQTVNVRAAQRGDWAVFQKSLAEARKMLQPVAAYAKKFTIYLVGQSHIDAAWLWRWRETVDVCRNTFKTQLDLMNEFPEYKFTESSAQFFKWMEDDYPAVFKEIRERVKQKRWNIVGGTIIESDCNLIGGESWARQYLYGKHYFRRKFGVDVDLGWNPDSFGYTWNMPQFLKRSGVRGFLTLKINRNDTNVFPYHLFWWEAPDGSRVLTYFPFVDPDEDDYFGLLLAAVRMNLANTGRTVVGVPFGTGDHGGGPEREILRTIRFSQTAEVFPKIVLASADDFFQALFNSNLSDLPVWRDELYFELHRGTYTTHGEIKRNNREKEILLTNAEKVSTLAELLGKKVYQKAAIVRAWWLYLFNQFHDILPGSSITPVYQDAMEDYQKVGKKGNAQLHSGLEAIAASVRTRGKGQPIVVFNTLSWPRNGLVKIPYTQNPGPVVVRDPAGRKLLSQWVVSPKDDTLLFVAKNVPALGYRVYFVQPTSKLSEDKGVSVKGFQLENRFLRLKVDPKTGNWVEVFDKQHQKELLEKGQEGNRLQLFQDIPKRNDAWNIGYTGKRWEIDRADTVFVKERGPVRAVIRVKKSFLGPSKSRRYPTKDFPSSFFTQDVTVYRDLPWADCEMTVDWWEDHVLAKAAFPLSVQSQEATYEIPYATIERPTGRSNSWDRARFEDSAQNWADLSGPDYGVSLLNHVKQGYDTPNGHTLRLTLLRSPLSPDPTADRGVNRFRYALYGHAGDWRDGETVLRGYEYNVPLLAVRASSHKGALPPEFSFVQVEPRTVILAALKEAESQDGVIFRFYEWQGKDTRVRVHFFRTPVRITEVNLIEDEQGVVPFSGRTFEFSIGHNAIRSFKVKF